MTDQRKSPGGVDRNGTSNIVFLFGKNEKSNTIKRPQRQLLSVNQRRDFLDVVSTSLRHIPMNTGYNIGLYLWQLVQQDIQEVSDDRQL